MRIERASGMERTARTARASKMRASCKNRAGREDGTRPKSGTNRKGGARVARMTACRDGDATPQNGACDISVNFPPAITRKERSMVSCAHLGAIAGFPCAHPTRVARRKPIEETQCEVGALFFNEACARLLTKGIGDCHARSFIP